MSADLHLADARQSLAYWEARARRLPRRALRRRREARAMAARWRARVAEAERREYGRGLLGAALLLVVERRLPATTSYRARRTLRLAAGTALAVALTCAIALGALTALAIKVLFDIL
jgi:hypothetical protein